jgi:putative ABC transport system substrate-binding protein
LRELGHVEGQSVAIEYRFAERTDQLPAFAGELIGLKVDLLVAGGSEAVRAAKDATDTLPIVMTNSADPVTAGFVASLPRPGGNVTGLTQIAPQLAAKRLELLRETVSDLTRVAVLWNPGHPLTPVSFREVQAAASTLQLQLQSLAVREPAGLASAFEAATRERAGALVVLRDPFTVREMGQIVELAMKGRLPAMYETRDFVDAGGLMIYGPSLADLYRRAASYVDKILKGARPADLPVEQPTTFDLIINLKTAQLLGLTVPPAVLQQATEITR